jgi:arsenite methyltransferase
VKAVAEAFGYSANELTSIPAGANVGLSVSSCAIKALLRFQQCNQDTEQPIG